MLVYFIGFFFSLADRVHSQKTFILYLFLILRKANQRSAHFFFERSVANILSGCEDGKENQRYHVVNI